MLLPLFQTIKNQFFSDVKSSALRTDRITRITDMSASSHIIRVENIQPHNSFRFCIDRYTAVTLAVKKYFSRRLIQTFLLWKCNSFFYNFIPDLDHLIQVFRYIFSYFNIMVHLSVPLSHPLHTSIHSV